MPIWMSPGKTQQIEKIIGLMQQQHKLHVLLADTAGGYKMNKLTMKLSIAVIWCGIF